MRVSKEEFIEAIKRMKHVGFASPDPAHGYFDTREYFEGDGLRAEMWTKNDGSGEAEYFICTLAPEERSQGDHAEGGGDGV